MTGISAIVAMADNFCIGKDNDLPWHIPEDLKRFKTLTMGKPVIMGRRTFESIYARLGEPLPGRTNIVVSRGGFKAEGVVVCQDITAAIEKARELVNLIKNTDEIFIIGGAQIYELAMPYIDRLYMTKIHTDVDGDAFFPVLDEKEWQQTARQDFEGVPAFSFITLERV